MSDITSERQSRAISAALKVAARFGVESDRPTILQDSNNTVIHLAPAPVVAKVGTSPEEAGLADEMMVAQFLAAMDGLIVPPTSLFPPGPHREGGLEATFWEYWPHDSAEPSPDVHGHALKMLHDALAGYREPLPAWDRFDGAGRVLEDSSALHALTEEDRAFLRRRYQELLSDTGSFRPAVRPLHGEPHSSNLLLSSHGPRWIDFESACLGPQEWDLTMLPDEVVARYFENVDWELLRDLRQMRSLCVAVWCWLDPDRAPVLREAGTYHLAALRGGANS